MIILIVFYHRFYGNEMKIFPFKIESNPKQFYNLFV